MDDMILWGESARFLNEALGRSRDFLARELALEIKPHPYINRTAHGVDFLGCRVLRDHIILNRRSRTRFRRKLHQLETQYLRGEVDRLGLQARATSLIAFTRAGNARSWRFRRRVLQQLPVSGQRPRTG
jgi:hypothetical protein